MITCGLKWVTACELSGGREKTMVLAKVSATVAERVPATVPKRVAERVPARVLPRVAPTGRVASWLPL